ncbi:MAG TPA: deoxyhypusine synthase family protein [Candidatus Portnoybacteria bacterium]|nr:deoxyhypusine synthase family protein [Candidatus Portnoybacteria bacterium]
MKKKNIKQKKSKVDFKIIKEFIDHNYRHFNSTVLKDASVAYVNHIKKGGKMFLAMGGAMSTAELGISLAEMIRQDKIHAISCTGANLEEDIFNLVANKYYKMVPNYRDLSPEDEEDLLRNNFNRVTDTCIPEEEAMRRIEGHLIKYWQKAEQNGERYFPYEYMYQLIRSGVLKQYYQIDPKDSWMLAACEKNLPIFVPGWEDSTLGNIFAALTMGRGDSYHGKNIKNIGIVKSGLETMVFLINWYLEATKKSSLGFFQIGGGISGDFPICVVPLIQQDLGLGCKLWEYFCQISDSTTSYGSYSGAVPNEKITWGKLGKNTPRFVIESDATIVAPLMFAYILGAE